MIRTYVIYDHPKDYPQHFVVRAWEVVCGVPVPIPSFDCLLANSLEEARSRLPEGLINIGREACDDPRIREVWV